MVQFAHANYNHLRNPTYMLVSAVLATIERVRAIFNQQTNGLHLRQVNVMILNIIQ